ncbi:sugar transferase [Candidatus Dojkabacteria bacterium]|jgi:sugar transferase EpsL|nr:sugar transferase [Candidatus Dojkabacteria bacterium]
MSIIYKSKRIGKNGKPFWLYKFRTLMDNIDKTSSFAQQDQYVKFGKFLRKTKIDELPQLINWIKGDINFFGYRPEEERAWNILPSEIREILSKNKPGIIDLSSLHFYDEETLLQVGDANKTYWEVIRPMKLTLQMFYSENRCWILNLAIIYIYFRKALKSLWKK